MRDWRTNPKTFYELAVLQAEWELDLEKFEESVAEEKERLRNKKPWFPWRITITKL